MALVDVDSWAIEFESAERLSESLLTQISQRVNRQKLSPGYNRLTNSIQIGLTQFETELLQLKNKLDNSRKDNKYTSDEIERRNHQIETLQSQLLQLKSKFNNAGPSDRTAVLELASNSRSPWLQDNASTVAIIETSDVETLKKKQIQILEDQNKGLETLSQTISRQRTLATQLGQEVEDQNDILDNLANTMERVESGVTRETGGLSQINRRDSTWGYWLVIIALFVAIVVVAFV